MCESIAYERDLPAAAQGAVAIVTRLVDAGHEALLAGGCVRDLLLGRDPQDYDVATDAPPEAVCRLFRKTRRVGAQFGVVLVRQHRRWIEVATFRSDDVYVDGRRPTQVHFCDARTDAQRRDFTVNGMFLDPLGKRIIDYVGGRADLPARLIRAIGDPAARFAEDHLRLLRAVRFAARLEFEIEAETFAAIRTHAAKLATVAAERVREELDKMLAHPNRARAMELLAACGLHEHLWPGAEWVAGELDDAIGQLRRLPARATFPLALAILLEKRETVEIERICRALTCSNEQREAIGWLVAHRDDLLDPGRPTLADLKRLLAHAQFSELRTWIESRYTADTPDDPRPAALAERIAAIPADAIQPEPFVTGDDLIALGVPTGPIYARLLNELYTQQLDDTLACRDDALRLLRRRIAEAEQ